MNRALEIGDRIDEVIRERDRHELLSLLATLREREVWIEESLDRLGAATRVPTWEIVTPKEAARVTGEKVRWFYDHRAEPFMLRKSAGRYSVDLGVFREWLRRNGRVEATIESRATGHRTPLSSALQAPRRRAR